MATADFEVNEEDCAHLLRASARKISQIQSGSNGGSDFIAAIRRDLSDAEQNLKNMEREIRRVPLSKGHLKKQLQRKTRQYRADWQAQQKDLERLTIAQNRDDLLGGRGNGGGGGGGSAAGERGRAAETELEHQQRLDDANQRLDHGTQLISQAKRTVAETEEIGIGTMENMHGQREQLIGAHEKVRDTNVAAIEARGLLNRMFIRAIYNRLFLYGIIVLLLGFILFMAIWLLDPSAIDGKSKKKLLR